MATGLEPVTLNYSTYLPEAMIENWDSFIWTERYYDAGDFELTTHDIARTRALLPLNTFISMRDTTEVMMVENHEISRDENNVAYLKVTGRSVFGFLENREALGNWFVGGFGEQNISPYGGNLTIGTAVASLLYISTVKTFAVQRNTEPVTRFQNDVNDILPILAGYAEGSDLTSIQRFASTTSKYEAIKSLLPQANLGIKSVRPPSSWTNIIVIADDFSTSTTSVTNTPKIVLMPYYGRDRTSTVVFHNESGYISSPKYVESIKDFKNVMTIVPRGPESPKDDNYKSQWHSITMTRKNVSGTPSGFNRRILVVDGSSVDNKDPGFNATYQNTMIGLGEKTISKKNKTGVFDGSITGICPYIYGVDYGLGDMVGIIEDFGLTASLRVTEFVRTFNAEGYTEYPTLARDDNDDY